MRSIRKTYAKHKTTLDILHRNKSVDACTISINPA